MKVAIHHNVDESVMEEMLVELRIEANEWLQEKFEISLNIPIKANGRLKRSMGRFRYRISSNEPINIELAKDALKNGYDTTWEILKHELVHYALCVQGRPFSDNDEDFIETCDELRVIRQGDLKLKRKRVVMECTNCGYEWIQSRKIYGYRHTACNAPIVFKEHRVI